MADVAIAIGHHPDAPGAPLWLEGHKIHEFEYWEPVARELALTLWQQGVAAEVIERPNEDPDQALADKVNATGAEAAIELHFNAATDGWGTEMLHYPGSVQGKALATALQRETVKTLGLRDRGLVPKAWPFLELTKMPAVICEPFFGSDNEDAFRGLTRLPDLMRAYRHAIISFLDEPVA